MDDDDPAMKAFRRRSARANRKFLAGLAGAAVIFGPMRTVEFDGRETITTIDHSKAGRYDIGGGSAN